VEDLQLARQLVEAAEVMVLEQTPAAPAEVAEVLVQVAHRWLDRDLMEVQGLPMEQIIGSAAVAAAPVPQADLPVQQKVEMAVRALKSHG